MRRLWPVHNRLRERQPDLGALGGVLNDPLRMRRIAAEKLGRPVEDHREV
jgi:hypothetical protein